MCNNTNLLLIRDRLTADSTQGKLYINGEYQCETLELPWLDNKKSISLNPIDKWKDKHAYKKSALKLNSLFNKNYSKIFLK